MVGKRKRIHIFNGTSKRVRTSKAVLPKRAASIIRTLGKLGIESKFYDKSLVAAVLTATTDMAGMEHNPSATISLNSVLQGDTGSDRDGRQISMQSIIVKGTIQLPTQVNQTVLDLMPHCYVALVLDTQCNGALLNSEDVLVNPSADALLCTESFKNLKFQKRFRILASKVLKFPQSMATGEIADIEIAGGFQHFTLFKDLKDLVVNYSAGTETIVNTTDNSLSIIACTNSTAAIPVMNYNSRLRFRG